MKAFIFLFITVALATTDISAQMEQNFNLNDYRWNSRVLLIFSPNSIYTDLTRTMEMVQSNRDGFRERDLKVFHVLQNIGNSSGDNVLKPEDGRKMRDQYEIDPSEFKILLIGKDGRVKMRTNDVLTSEILFEEIDAMPMRRLEMKEDG